MEKNLLYGREFERFVQSLDSDWILSDERIEKLVYITRDMIFDYSHFRYNRLDDLVFQNVRENKEKLCFNDCFTSSYRTNILKKKLVKICRDVKKQFRRQIKAFTFGEAKVPINEFYMKMARRYLSLGSSALREAHCTRLLILRRLARENPEVLDRAESHVVPVQTWGDGNDADDDSNFGGDEDDESREANNGPKDWWFCVELWLKDRMSDHWGLAFDSLEWRNFLHECRMIEERDANIIYGLHYNYGLPETPIQCRYQSLSRFDDDERPRRCNWRESLQVLRNDCDAMHGGDAVENERKWDASRLNSRLQQWINEQQKHLDNRSEMSPEEISDHTLKNAHIAYGGGTPLTSTNHPLPKHSNHSIQSTNPDGLHHNSTNSCCNYYNRTLMAPIPTYPITLPTHSGVDFLDSTGNYQVRETQPVSFQYSGHDQVQIPVKSNVHSEARRYYINDKEVTTAEHYSYRGSRELQNIQDNSLSKRSLTRQVSGGNRGGNRFDPFYNTFNQRRSAGGPFYNTFNQRRNSGYKAEDKQ